MPSEMTLKKGCEVYFTPAILQMDAAKLCLEGTAVLLLELPVLQKPAFLAEVLTALAQRGITVLIAHAERYQYVARDPRLLAEWMELGALIQVNAQSVIDGGLARKLIKWGLCQIVASDAHSLEHRPPNLRAALDTIASLHGAAKARELEQNAAALYDGGCVPGAAVRMPRKVLGLWV